MGLVTELLINPWLCSFLQLKWYFPPINVTLENTEITFALPVFPTDKEPAIAPSSDL